MGLTDALPGGLPGKAGKVAGRVAGLRARGAERQDLLARVESLEADVLELRRHNLRLAEIADVVQELLVPLASRDQERIDAAIEKFSQSL